jgi:UDP-N-acetyl-D-galactosamine dehydrogenase
MPEIILAGRKLNDSMGYFIASEVLKLMKKKSITLNNANVLVMGLTFKENCPDTRNTRVVDVISELEANECNVDVYDPWVNPDETMREHSIEVIKKPQNNKYDAIVLTVAHDVFKKMKINKIKEFGKNNHVLYDVKYIFKPSQTDGRL